MDRQDVLLRLLTMLSSGWPLLVDASIKGAFLLMAAGLLTLAMRRRSTAQRHLVWLSAVSGALAMPLLSALRAVEASPSPTDADAQRQVSAPSLQRAETATRGRVVDAQGRGIAGAAIKRANSSWTATTDADGYFPLPEMKAGETARLSVSAPGFLPRGDMHVFHREKGQYGVSGQWPIRLARPVTLSGRVLGSQGKPLAGAPLGIDTWINLPQKKGSSGNDDGAVTDQQGRFTIGNLPPGSHVIYDPSHAPRSIPEKGAYGAVVVEPNDGEKLTDLTIDLSQSTASVEGQVIGPDGKPLAGTTVYFGRFRQWQRQSGGSGPNPSSPVTGADGRYKVTGLGPGQWYVGSSHPHFQRGSPSKIVTLTPGQTVHQDVRVTEHNDEDNAVSRAVAEAERTDDLQKLARDLYCFGGVPPVIEDLAAFGYVTFLSLASGQVNSCRVDVKSLGLPRTTAPEEIARAAHAGELYFAPPNQLVTINGTIVAPFAPPASKGGDMLDQITQMTRAQLVEQVEASRRQNPDADGRRIAVRAGEKYLVVRSDNQGFLMHVDHVGSQGVGLTFLCVGHLRLAQPPPPKAATPAEPAKTVAKPENSTTVNGQVVDDETGRPIESFIYQGGRVDDKAPAKIRWGYFESRAMPVQPEGKLDATIDWNDEWRWRIVAPGYLPQPILDKPPAAGVQTITDHKVRLKRGRNVAGRVLNHDGTPAAGAAVFLVGPLFAWIGQGKALWDDCGPTLLEDNRITRTTADSEGRFTLSGGGSGAEAIAVSTPRLDAWAVPVPDSAAAAKGPEFTVKLPAPGRLILRYDIPGGPPEVKAWLSLQRSKMPGWNQVSYVREPRIANGGQVVLDDLPPGKYYLARVKPGQGWYCDHRDVTVESGKTATSDFARRRGTFVEGRVVGMKEEMFADRPADRATSRRLPSACVPRRKIIVRSVTGDTDRMVYDAVDFDADGKFKTDLLLPGQYEITAEWYVPEKYWNMMYTGLRGPDCSGRAVVTVPENGPPPQVTIELQSFGAKGGLPVRIRATDARTGKPIPSLTVIPAFRQRLPERPTWQSHAMKRLTGSRVEYLIESPWPATLLRIEADGCRPFITRPIERHEGKVTLDVALEPDAGLAGKVLLPDGTPAKGASVAVCTWTNEVVVRDGAIRYIGHGAKFRKLVETAADGTFLVAGEADPWVLVVAHASGYAEVPAAEFAKSSTVRLKPWGRIEGRLVLSGKPVAGHLIHVVGTAGNDVIFHNDQMVTTDAAGRFVAEHVRPVRLFVQPRFKQGDSTVGLLWVSGHITIAPGETTRITLPRPGRPIVGRVTLPPDTGLRLADYAITADIALYPPPLPFDEMSKQRVAAYDALMKSENGSMFHRDKIAVNAGGTFRIDGLPETHYMLHVKADRKPDAPPVAAGQTHGSKTKEVEVLPLADSKEPVDLGDVVLRFQ